MQGKYSDKQEIVNGIIHGFGILFGLSFLPVLISLAVKNHDTFKVMGTCIYSFCFLMTFTFSTLYHGFREQSVKQILKIYDHISIYFLIAGTYTPFLLIFLNNRFGNSLLSVLWGLTFIGTIFKSMYTGKFETASTIVYVLMGLLMLAGGRTFFDEMPAMVNVFIIIGAVLYIIGAVIYMWDKYTYTHAVWHCLVLTAAISHYIAVLLAVVH